ncbi:hypothetical protein MRB53_032366 [Persea americana]|uniref:Uncharacterized protein n=1 Tax=Persea americana TaxID=3435 RepID=A0ACC2KRQ5_PERAE|nr:hypothetical protein MRB53_032366 [Persea americana]
MRAKNPVLLATLKSNNHLDSINFDYVPRFMTGLPAAHELAKFSFSSDTVIEWSSDFSYVDFFHQTDNAYFESFQLWDGIHWSRSTLDGDRQVLEFRGNYGLATLGSRGRRGFHLEWFDLRSVMKDWIFMLGVLILSGFLQKSGGCREGDVISTHSA